MQRAVAYRHSPLHSCQGSDFSYQLSARKEGGFPEG